MCLHVFAPLEAHNLVLLMSVVSVCRVKFPMKSSVRRAKIELKSRLTLFDMV
jgi:hypothetical protein